jgi:DNA invertase Pin-like site-specific DNA recombinase
LGLEAQQAAVMAYLNGGPWELIAEFTEIETGKGANPLDKRPELRAALALCKKHGATLVIAKLDRLRPNGSATRSASARRMHWPQPRLVA